MKMQNIFWSAAILLICNFISRCLGFVYKIILVRLIGAEGIGITEMVSPVYSLALVAASLGIPLAMSKLLASEIGRRRFQNLRLIQQTSLALLIVLGAGVTLLCALLAPLLLQNLNPEARTLNYLRALTPAIFIVTVCSGFRAYFQATKQIGIIGVSQNIEQTVRVLAGAALVSALLPQGLPTALLGVAAATVLGELAGLFYIWLQYHRQRPENTETPSLSRFSIGLSLLAYGAPVTVQRLISSGILLLQATMLPLALVQSGLNSSQATAAYGNFSGVALALIHLPGIFTATLAMALLPAIAEIDNDKMCLSRRINQSLHLTAVIAAPFSLLFFSHATELCSWLFHAPEAAPPLRILALGAFFIYAQTALTSILQGMGKLNSQLISLLISGGGFMLAIRLLVPLYGLPGAAVAYLMLAASACMCDYTCLKLACAMRLDILNIFIKPLLALLPCIMILKTAKQFCSAVINNDLIVFLLAGSICGLAYLLLLGLLGGLPSVMLRYLHRPFTGYRK